MNLCDSCEKNQFSQRLSTNTMLPVYFYREDNNISSHIHLLDNSMMLTVSNVTPESPTSQGVEIWIFFPLDRVTIDIHHFFYKTK